jgi:chromosome segregation ATPase
MLALPSFKKHQTPNGSAERASAGRPPAPAYDFARFEALVARAEHAAEQLRSLDTSTDRAAQLSTMEERLALLDRTLAGAERLEGQLKAAQDRASRLSASHDRAEAQITATLAEVDRVRDSCADLVGKVTAAFELRDQLDRFLALQPQFTTMRTEADTVATQVRELTGNVSRLRAVHDDALRAHKHASARIDGIEQRSLATAGKMDAIERRATTADEALEALLRIAATVPDVHHQLGVLRAMADQVAQKTALVEQHRDAVDRAAGQVAHVAALNPQLETALRRQEEQVRQMTALEAKLLDVQSQQDAVLARAGEIGASQHRLEDAEQSATRTLAELRETMQGSAERFELENRSLDAVSERIAELRSIVTECEGRTGALGAVRRSLDETEARARGLSTHISAISEDIDRIGVQAERLRAVRDDVGQLDRSLEQMAHRVERVEEVRPTLDAMTQDLATLRGTQEAIRDGLEQVRVAYAEMTRLRERQSETDSWLAGTDARMDTLQGHVAELERMRPGIDALRADVDRLTASTGALESRSKTVDELHGRLSDLESRVSQLHERSDVVRTRMDAADTRFGDLARQAGEAQRVANTIGAVTAGVDAAERRLGAVSGVMDTVESRARALEVLGDRMRTFGQEIEQRQNALDRAGEHLARAAEARSQAADAAQRLEEVTHNIGAQLTTADVRASSVAQLLHDLDGRIAALGNVEKRMAHFDELLGKWETAQDEAASALEQVGSRQAMIDAVRSQIAHVVELAERASENVRSITAARRDVEETKAMLDSTQEQLRDATSSMRDFSEHRRQVEELERRLARADALALNVRASVEVIAAQRAYVDQVLERSGTLAFQMKQAEALTEALRHDCAIATQMRAAVEENRRGE